MHTFLVCGESASDAGLLHEVLGKPGRSFASAFQDERYEDVDFDKDTHAGLIILGSNRRESCHDEVAYREELRLLRSALGANKPVLGICAGAQLIAYEKGYRPRSEKSKADKNLTQICLVGPGPDDPVLRYAAPPSLVTQSHWDTFEPPIGATDLARSPNNVRPHSDAFRMEGGIYALQFHPEPTFTMLKNGGWWYRFRPTDDQLREVEATGRRMLEAWVTLAIEISLRQNLDSR